MNNFFYVPGLQESSVKEIRDNIHGLISLTDQEMQIISTPIFQRLRRIKQLGGAHLVYPNAIHNRFSHSIGVLSLMGKLGAKFLNNGRPGWTEGELKRARLAGLLHDIGHSPYSHALENIVKSSEGNSFADHELIGSTIIKNSDITDILNNDSETEADYISATLTKDYVSPVENNYSTLSMITSDIDLDRMDYLIRDSQFTGVNFGKVELEYFLQYFDINEEPDNGKGFLCLHEKALQPLESYLLGRYFMYETVYLHRVTGSFDLLSSRVLQLMIDSGDYPDIPSEFKISNIDLWEKFDDSLFEVNAKDASIKSSNPHLKLLADSLMNRKRLKQVVNLEVVDDTKGSSIIEDILKDFPTSKDNPWHWKTWNPILDVPNEHLFIYYRISGLGKKLLRDIDNYEEEGIHKVIKIIQRNKKDFIPLGKVNHSIIHSVLEQPSKQLLRIYTTDPFYNRVKSHFERKYSIPEKYFRI